jgi:hypothetical protein
MDDLKEGMSVGGWVIASRIEEDNGGHSLNHEDPERKYN